MGLAEPAGEQPGLHLPALHRRPRVRALHGVRLPRAPQDGLPHVCGHVHRRGRAVHHLGNKDAVPDDHDSPPPPPGCQDRPGEPGCAGARPRVRRRRDGRHRFLSARRRDAGSARRPGRGGRPPERVRPFLGVASAHPASGVGRRGGRRHRAVLRLPVPGLCAELQGLQAYRGALQRPVPWRHQGGAEGLSARDRVQHGPRPRRSCGVLRGCGGDESRAGEGARRGDGGLALHESPDADACGGPEGRRRDRGRDRL